MSDNPHTQKAAREREKAVTKAKRNRDKARRKLLQQRQELAELRKRNRQISEENREDDGANPTARSTLPSQKTNAETAARNSHSTVPEPPKYSTVEPRERLYGLKLYNQTNGSGEQDSSNDDTAADKNGGDHDE